MPNYDQNPNISLELVSLFCTSVVFPNTFNKKRVFIKKYIIFNACVNLIYDSLLRIRFFCGIYKNSSLVNKKLYKFSNLDYLV